MHHDAVHPRGRDEHAQAIDRQHSKGEEDAPTEVGELRRLTSREILPLAWIGSEIEQLHALGLRGGAAFGERRVVSIPAERPLVYGGVMYIPPFGTVNRQIPDVLGKFKLDTGDGILIHGTNDPLAVGFWGTHGCVRLFDDDIEFVYENAPVGTPVYIY